MNRHTLRERIPGPAGWIEVAVDNPPELEPRGLALVAHPHPLHGGSLDNKVAQTLARAWVQLGFMAVRPNFRGVGQSEGVYDAGRGETEDLHALLEHYGSALAARLGIAAGSVPLALAGFSFGAYVAANLAHRLHQSGLEIGHLTLVGAAVVNFPVPPLLDAHGEPLAGRSLAIHGERDDVVPLAAVLDWARPQPHPILVMPGAGHFFHGMLTPLKNAICTWHGAQQAD